MEICRIARARRDRINQRIDESERLVPIGHRLLIDQSQITSPHRRSKRSAAIFIGGTSGLVGANVESKIGIRGNVRPIPQSLRASRASSSGSSLPGRNGKFIRRNSAAAIHPNSLRTPSPASGSRNQIRPANGSNVNIIRRPNRGTWSSTIRYPQPPGTNSVPAPRIPGRKDSRYSDPPACKSRKNSTASSTGWP